MQKIVWAKTLAAIWRAKKGILRPVNEVDKVYLNELIGIDNQKEQMVENVMRFIEGKTFNHVLLWGARGTGKSSLIKAMLMEFHAKKLRVIEVARDDLSDLPDIIDNLRVLPYYFLIFCDDLSFEAGDSSYKGLKSTLEGSIEAPANNVLICATSNRRHLVSEDIADNDNAVVRRGELHYGDAVEERISLSDRFGLWLSFYHGTLKDYLDTVDFYFKDFDGDRELLHQEAKEFSALRASRSGRTAKQFYNSFKDKFIKISL